MPTLFPLRARLPLAVLATMLAAQGAVAADEGLATAVLVDQELAQVHQLSALPLERVYADMSSAMPGTGAIPSTGNIAGARSRSPSPA